MLKKTFQVIMIIIMITTFPIITYCQEKTDEFKPESLLVLGDSISTGYGLENYSAGKLKTTSYCNLLARKYSLGDTYVNMAVDGMTSQELLDNLTQKLYDKYISSSDVIIISIGGNDAMAILGDAFIAAVGLPAGSSISDLQTLDFTDPNIYRKVIGYFTSSELSSLEKKIVSDFENNFKAISKKIYEMNPNATVIYQNVYNPFSGVDSLTFVANITDSIISDINKIIAANSILSINNNKTNIYRYIDVYSAFKSQASTYTNISKYDIHPNAEGHKKISELCDTALLNKNINQTSMEVVAMQDSSSVVETADSSLAESSHNSSESSLSSGKMMFIALGGASLVIVIAALGVVKFRRNQK